MIERLTNINAAKYEIGKSNRSEEDPFQLLDLGGQHLGVRIEEIPVGGTTSHHHYHTTEKEHVLVLEGSATLHLGNDDIELTLGDHIWFAAGEAVAHHIENTSTARFKFLVFGERKQDDVVVYPKRSVLLVKSSGGLQAYQYKSLKTGS